MARQFYVTVFAGVVHTATLHLDCDDVRWAVIVLALRAGIEIDTAHINRLFW
jgi:hypothetical protein